MIERRKSSSAETDVETDGEERRRREGKGDMSGSQEKKDECTFRKEALRSKGNSLWLKLDRERKTVGRVGMRREGKGVG